VTRLIVLATMLAIGLRVEAAAQGILDATLGGNDPHGSEVSTAALRELLASRAATVIDARPRREFARGHIPGAINVAGSQGRMPSDFVSDVEEIKHAVSDRDHPIVLYCNGPFCGKSRRLAQELEAAGFTRVRRYQLGIPVWRALGGVTAMTLEGVRHVIAHDGTAVLIDARDSPSGTRPPGIRHVPLSDVAAAKDDGRLPMEDHNTRIVVMGEHASQARAVAEAIAAHAFHNVAFYDGLLCDLAAVSACERR
jgi:rhodanese-related sulfurtransferase